MGFKSTEQFFVFMRSPSLVVRACVPQPVTKQAKYHISLTAHKLGVICDCGPITALAVLHELVSLLIFQRYNREQCNTQEESRMSYGYAAEMAAQAANHPVPKG